MKNRKKTKTELRVDALMAQPADLRTLRQPGEYLNLHDKLALELATAIHESESDDCAVSWSAQERAQNYFNTHGFIKTLDELFRVKALKRPTSDA